jgi:hypothetical protein
LDADNFRGKPFSAWKIFNGSFIGAGKGGSDSSDNRGPEFRENGAGKMYQSIIFECLDAGINVSDSDPIHAGDPFLPDFDQLDNGNTVLSTLQCFVYERDFGGEFNFADIPDRAGAADGVLRNNMWWSCGVPGAVTTVDDLKVFLRHDGRTGFSDNDADFSTVPGDRNEFPFDVYVLDALFAQGVTGAIDIDGDGAMDEDIEGSLVKLPFYQAFGDSDNASDSGYFTRDHGNTLHINPGLRSVYRLNNPGTGADTFDPRLVFGDDDLTGDDAAARAAGDWINPLSNEPAPEDNGFYTNVEFRGAFQDNLWLKGWSILDQAGAHAYAGLNVLSSGENPTAPTPKIALDNSGNPVVSFEISSDENRVQFSIERSTDGRKTFVPVAVAQDNTANDDDNSSESIQFTDAGVNLVAGDEPVVYRVVPL